MCGIVAAFARDGGVSTEALRRGITALRHRGPDGDGLYVDPQGRAGLAHARLSIIDLSTGAQPLMNEDGRVHAVVNGELYDHDRIRKELTAAGHALRTESDSEIALHLYEDFGAQCVHQLRGEFALVIWDERNQTLFAARDRFGIKPLYYAEVGGTLYLASEIKALFAVGVPARWDSEAMYQRLIVGHQLDRTLFAGVRQVPPGHYLTVSAQGMRLLQYWDFDYPRAEDVRSRPIEESIERVRAALSEAVRLRLRADVPVGCYLSGGIDSCAMLGIANTLRASPLTAFTVSFEDERFDETEIAREMAERVGAEFHCFRMDSELRGERFADAVIQNETMIAGNGVAKFMLSEKVRDLGYKVVLTGEGSDEIFAGYAGFAADVTPAPARPGVPNASIKYLRQRLGFVPRWLGARMVMRGFTERGLSSGFRAQFQDYNVVQAHLDGLDLQRQCAGRPTLHQSMYLWSKTHLPNVMLHSLGDRSEMAHSIEGRLPMLDHALVELVAGLPADHKIRDGVAKYVLREAVRPYVTQTVFQRRKHPFVSPPGFTGRMAELAQDLLRGPTLDAMPFFDRTSVVAALDALSAGATPSRAQAPRMALMPVLGAAVLQAHYRPSC
jgi:asparagine synthase (glutamine-hydrolysing)